MSKDTDKDLVGQFGRLSFCFSGLFSYSFVMEQVVLSVTLPYNLDGYKIVISDLILKFNL